MCKDFFKIEIAVFGGSGIGKTVLLSTFFGFHQEAQFKKNNGYELMLNEQLEESRELLSLYRKIKTVNSLTSFGSRKYTKYLFKMQIPEIEQTPHIVWHDYPGGWPERSPRDKAEIEDRDRAFRNLLECQVTFLLFDGKELSEKANSNERINCIRNTFDAYKSSFNNIYKDYKPSNDKSFKFPPTWVLCVTKSDLFSSHYTAHDFYNEVMEASDNMISFKETVERLSQTPKNKSFSLGEHFFMLSSVKMDKTGRIIDPHFNRGVDLIPALGLRVPLEYKFRNKMRLNMIIRLLGSLGVLLKLIPVSIAEEILDVPLSDLLATASEKLKEKSEQAKKKNYAIKYVLLKMLEKLRYAEELGNVYLYKPEQNK